MTTHRIHNFSAGPSALPTEVILQAQEELPNYKGAGMSVMEMSHRSKPFDAILENAEKRVRNLLGLSNDYSILFMQGGASMQFAMVPMNFCKKGRPVDVVNSGYWAKKAADEIKKVGEARIVATGETSKFAELPKVEESAISPEASYLHYCSNNTIAGTQWKSFVTKKGIPTVVDMSSDILCRRLDHTQFDLIFAGAQKNLGPSGVTLVAIKNELAEQDNTDLPKYFQYREQIEGGSRFNTPTTFGIYMVGLVLEWIEKQGGLDAIEKRNVEKAKILYDVIDKSDFYTTPIPSADRSMMNAVFKIKGGDEALEAKFVKEATAEGLDGLKGHRSVGGLRASIYNAQPREAVEALISFMQHFESKN